MPFFVDSTLNFPLSKMERPRFYLRVSSTAAPPRNLCENTNAVVGAGCSGYPLRARSGRAAWIWFGLGLEPNALVTVGRAKLVKLGAVPRPKAGPLRDVTP